MTDADSRVIYADDDSGRAAGTVIGEDLVTDNGVPTVILRVLFPNGAARWIDATALTVSYEEATMY